MNKYEIVFFIWMTLLTIGFSFIFFELMDRTKKLKDTVDILDSYIDTVVNPKIKMILQLVNDEIINNKQNYKEDKKTGTGKWIRIESDGTYGLSYWYTCSVCHNKVPKSEYRLDYFSPYCPACGAKMREVEE